MAKNSKLTLGKRTFEQTIYSEPRRVFINRYISARGLKLVKEGTLTKEQADQYYGRNRYGLNENAKPIRTIVHVLQLFKR